MSEHPKKPMDRRVLILSGLILLVLGGGIAGTAYFLLSNKTIQIEKASVEAPTVNLAARTGGPLRSFMVKAGDVIPPNTVVAQVGVELIKSTQGGLVLATQGDLGKSVAPGTTVVEMIDPSALRIVGELDENKGLSRVKVGDPVSFTIDAFGSTEFTGVVDEVAPTSLQSGVVFNISSQRQVQQFDIKARFDTTKYPQLKNGMSARMTVWVE